MKKVRLLLVSLSIVVMAAQTVSAQNKKLDKRLAKIDNLYNAGSFEKAKKHLAKLKKGATKLGGANNYMVSYHLKYARINFALGTVTEFEKSLTDALTLSRTTFGETSTSYAITLLDAADNYLEYGNFRMAREYIEQSETILTNTNELTEEFKGRIALSKAEALVGQGFSNDAIALLAEYEPYFVQRAVDKETYVEEGKIKTRRVPENEIFERFHSYARLKMLMANAYAKKGRLSVGGDIDESDAERTFNELDSWLKGKRRYFGDATLVDVEYRYLWAKAYRENGNKEMSDKRLQLDGILSDIKKKTSPTHPLAHDVYLAYLQLLMETGRNSKYYNVKLEYERLIDRYYPKTSLHRVNMKAIEFDSKMAKDRTKTLENDALNVVGSPSMPKNHKTAVRIYNFLFDVAVAEKRFANAETYLNQLVSITADLCGENSPMHHLAKVRLANYYLDYTNRIEDAGRIYQESYFGVLEKEIDIRHPGVIPALNHIAQWHEYTDNFELATKTLNEARLAALQKYDDRDILLGIELNHIAKLQIKLGDYDAAETNITKALEVIDLKHNREYAEYVPAYTNALETQARLFGVKGLFDEAESNLSRADKTKRKWGTSGQDDLSTASELASLNIQLGDYRQTDYMLDMLIQEYERLYGKNTLRLIDPLVNKGRILLAKGDYTEATAVAQRANQLAVSIYGESSTKAAPTQKLLSDIYYTLGDYEKAEESVTKALTSQEKQFGRMHIEVAKSISQLSLVKFHRGGNKREIENLMLESRDIMAAKLGQDNPQYAEILKNVAVLYISEQKFDIAFHSLTVAENIWKAKAGRKNNINTASIYTLTGDVYYQLKNYKKAEEFYNKAKDLYARFFNKNHPEYVRVISKLAKVAYMQKDYKKSRDLIEVALDNYETFIKTLFPALSERQKAKYWNTMRPDFEFYNTLAFGNIDDLRRITGRLYNYQLMTKALLLSSSIKVRERILNSNDETLKAQYNNWVQKKELLTLALSMNDAQLAESEIDPVRLQYEVEGLEKELSQKSELFAQNVETKRIQFGDVKSSLKPNEVALEIVRYRHFDHTFTDSVIYAALYLKPEFKEPKAIILKEGHRLETRFFAYYRNAIMSKVHDRISYGVFWQPIINEVGQASTIYLSADGVYNQINLEAIPTPDGRYVIDNSNIILVSNTKDIFLRKSKDTQTPQDNVALMFGNPTFYVSAATDQRTIAPLPGTKREIIEVQSILSQKGYQTAEFLDTDAEEERIKEVNSPRILHFATHGLYKPTEEVTLEEQIEGNEAILTQNPLMRTGLLLTGAGDLLQKTDYNYNMESGILTAYEAMSLNLDKTDLVVLSACETGLGKVESGEGVFGLQRAFLNAGAKTLIMSMFKVDDVATQKLMQKFYLKWTTTGNLRQSFIDAKKELRLEYEEPIYWGAFMMIGLE